LGVNVSTVSRALRGLEGVSQELRQKILSLAKEQGYRPNPFAVSLRYDTTRTIGIVVPDVSFNHYAQIVKRIEAEARKVGYMCIITDSDDKYENEKNCIDLLVNMHVEGIIICLAQDTTDFSHIQHLKKIHMPVVLFDRDADIDISSVVINDIESAREVTFRLIDSGAKRIAFLGGPNKLKQTADRKHGYLEALRERGIPIRKELVKCDFLSFSSGFSNTTELLDMHDRPDAIVASHGLLTLSSMKAIEARGMNVPNDISVVGYMSDWISEVLTPRVSFVKQNQKEIAVKAFKLLHDQMDGDTCVQHIIVKANLELRDSTR
jgi:LacI family transcriptional regulator